MMTRGQFEVITRTSWVYKSPTLCDEGKKGDDSQIDMLRISCCVKVPMKLMKVNLHLQGTDWVHKCCTICDEVYDDALINMIKVDLE